LGYGMTMPPPKPDIRYYGGTKNAEPAVHEASYRRRAGSMTVYSGTMMVLSKTSGTAITTVTIYDLTGRSVLSIVTAKTSITLTDFGIRSGVYLTRID
ncbi:MAG: T9SS type A sorting domain-containing protein, partial [Chitinispirillaceae bacterium]|nr:T9SS type A sorting domain-containing protein [Chitinispirillaceae bacterium]